VNARSEPERADQAAEGKTAWLSNEERGTVLGIRFVVWLCNFFGRRAARAFIYVLAAYYTAFAAHGRRASRAWLSFVLGRPARMREVYEHLSTFALVALDRVFLLQGQRERFVLDSHGTELLDALTARKQGAVLLGAHIGSFEAMRARAGGRGHDIRVLAYFENAKKITQVLAAVAPEMHERVIPLGSLDSLLKAKEAVEAGAMVAMLGDRTGLNAKTTQVMFMGKPAPLPTGPFLLAASLGCPVLFVCGIYRGDNWYEMHCEEFAERVVLPRGAREEALQKYAQAYADRLAHYARAHPYNWFNLYDFWNP